MSQGPDVRVTRESRPGGEIAFVTFDHEARLNALGEALMDHLMFAIDALSRDEHLRCVVLTGAGERAFAAGADVNELAAIAFPAEARTFIGKVHACCELVRNLPMPVIARLNGVTLGAGLELAISCDVRIAAAHARFGMPEVRLGVPSVVEAALLPGMIGWGRTRAMLLLGGDVDAEAALAMGLVDAVARAGQLDAVVDAHIERLLANRPQALRLQKALIRRWEDLSLRDAISVGAEVFSHAYYSTEPTEALEAWRAAHGKASTVHTIRLPPKPAAEPAAKAKAKPAAKSKAKPAAKSKAKTAAKAKAKPAAKAKAKATPKSNVKTTPKASRGRGRA